jgi:hypothetical protein
MMMGTEWLIWVVVAVVLLRLVTRRGRWHRDWLWYDEWLDSPDSDGKLPGRRARGGDRYGRAYRQRGLARRREALERAADHLEGASQRLRRKAWRGGPMTVDRRPSMGSSASSRSRVAAGKPAETRLQALQRRFAEGRITMEQYERELDKLYGLT